MAFQLTDKDMVDIRNNLAKNYESFLMKLSYDNLRNWKR